MAVSAALADRRGFPSKACIVLQQNCAPRRDYSSAQSQLHSQAPKPSAQLSQTQSQSPRKLGERPRTSYVKRTPVVSRSLMNSPIPITSCFRHRADKRPASRTQRATSRNVILRPVCQKDNRVSGSFQDSLGAYPELLVRRAPAPTARLMQPINVCRAFVASRRSTPRAGRWAGALDNTRFINEGIALPSRSRRCATSREVGWTSRFSPAGH